MITSNGDAQFLNLLTGKATRFADMFAVGVSDEIGSKSDTQLKFGWATCPISDSYVDLDNNQVVFHGTLPADLAGDIWEIGLISQSSDFINTGLPNALVYNFEPTELWVSDLEYEITNTSSVGTNNYKLNDVVAGNYLAKIVSNVNISRYDTIKLRLTASHTASLKIIMKNDELNYAHGTQALTAGLNSITVPVSSLTKVGSFNPNQIFEIRFEVVSVGNATNSIEFDAMSLTSNINGGLVARDVRSEVMYKRLGATMEIEYAVRYNNGTT